MNEKLNEISNFLSEATITANALERYRLVTAAYAILANTVIPVLRDEKKAYNFQLNNQAKA